MGRLLAEPLLEYPIELFWVDDGLPGHFILRGENSAELVFHTRHLLMSQYLQSLFRPEFGELSQLCESALLRFAAEFLLIRGCMDQALQTLAKSRLGNGVYFHEQSVNPDLESVPFGARYMSMWFSGVCHELGHVAHPDVVHRLHDLDALSVDRIDVALRELMQHFYPENVGKVLSLISERGDSSKASIESIREESRCDIFGLLLLMEAFKKIVDLGHEVRESSEPVDFLFMYLVELGALDLMEHPKLWAQWFVAGNNLNVVGPAEHRLAISSRVNALLKNVQDSQVLKHVAPDWEAADWLSTLKEGDIHGLSARLQTHFDFFESGLQSARDFMSSSEMREVTLFKRYMELISSDPLAQQEAMVFLRVAKGCGRSSHQLDQIAEVCGIGAT